ncbi:cryptochrome/photolyase family protein [Sedimentitalea sp. HM32M-2]|uniref:cryptochrome/photolyase family protein n=1 Tax=Sedimentitalea sp. HM32M-2 TaxID=3351566 RepID=UPI00363C7F24
MAQNSPILMWFRRDLRLGDHPALTAASATGRPVIPVFILDAAARNLGAAARFRLGLGLDALARALAAQGSRLILRRGDALEVLQALIAETGADTVYWSRLYDPQAVARDTAVKSALRAQGLTARSFGGHLMFEPWTVKTGTGSFYRVFTPMWKAVRAREVDVPLPPPDRIPPPENWPDSDDLDDWAMARALNRGAAVLRPHIQPGEAAALARLDRFVGQGIDAYRDRRDLPAEDGTSGLAEYLSLGEISPHRCWHAALRARHDGMAGAETFQKQLVWREFAYHLMHHTPHILTDNWRREWDGFPWITDPAHPHVRAWKQGRTGMAFVDAAMREMYVTGRMHNRGRMIAASYLTKHLMCHWKIGLDWFADCLVDWDPANNAMGWQWTAGSGPDAAPYFRVFNPRTQLDRFDPDRTYVRRWIAEGQADPPATACRYFDAIPRRWGLTADAPYPDPIVSASDGRAVALNAYENRDF